MDKVLRFPSINWASNELLSLKSFFDAIKSGLKVQYTEKNFKITFENCLHFFSVVPVPALEVTEAYILRARENRGTEVFNHQFEISYNNQCPSPIQPGRFNRVREPLFYGSIPLISQEAGFLVTSLVEASKSITNDKNTDTVFDFTVGRWKVKRLWPFVFALMKSIRFQMSG